MSRYRPPQKPGSKYITPDGYKILNDELNYLFNKKRPKVTQALSEAAAEGDRSENAEYIYRKKELREIDSRIRFLRKRLDGMRVIDQRPTDQSKIYFGAWVKIEDDDENHFTYRIVGPDETDAKKGFISMDAPMAKALMKQSVDSEISVTIQNKVMDYAVVKIWYE
ncbi:MAG: transcription elongation factor GreB [Methylococcales bacterium]|jgi:transcription elongation factor GreB|nr:transcription elongation factor GreB [Methylococcales bacterium]MBT7410793.1 transcription elongation factor GreB [Methylococcales bacterium]